nr:MrVIB=conotoxin [Conus marmoreus, venom, Peptide, 31 aa] [Conus marmoreus]1RMK_A Chain A, Mu-O-conotoxin MrVIB [Conus marmoreus]
ACSKKWEYCIVPILGFVYCCPGLICGPFVCV